MPGNPELAALCRDYADWDVESFEPGAKRVAVREDSLGSMVIISAANLGELRHRVDAARYQDTFDQARTRSATSSRNRANAGLAAGRRQVCVPGRQCRLGVRTGLTPATESR